MMLRKVMDVKNFPMEIFLKGSTYMENLMELEHISGEMGRDTMDNGSTVSSRDLECGEGKREIPTKESGSMANLMVMEFIHGRMETHTKENSKTV